MNAKISDVIGELDIRHEDSHIVIFHDGCYLWAVDAGQFRAAQQFADSAEADGDEAGHEYDRFWSKIRDYIGAEDGGDSGRIRSAVAAAGKSDLFE